MGHLEQDIRLLTIFGPELHPLLARVGHLSAVGCDVAQAHTDLGDCEILICWSVFAGITDSAGPESIVILPLSITFVVFLGTMR